MLILENGNAIDLESIEAIERLGNMGRCYVYLKGGNKFSTSCYEELLRALQEPVTGKTYSM